MEAGEEKGGWETGFFSRATRDAFLAAGQKGGAPCIPVPSQGTGMRGVWPVVVWRLNVRRIYGKSENQYLTV